jgi:hypothetical protein
MQGAERIEIVIMSPEGMVIGRANLEVFSMFHTTA